MTFNEAQPHTFGVGYTSPIIQAQMAEYTTAAVSCSDQNFSPVGTGLYVITELRPEDTVTYMMNELPHRRPQAVLRFGQQGWRRRRVGRPLGHGDRRAIAPGTSRSRRRSSPGWRQPRRPPRRASPPASALNLSQTDPYADPPSEGTPHPLFAVRKSAPCCTGPSPWRSTVTPWWPWVTARGSSDRNIWPVGAENSTNNDECRPRPRRWPTSPRWLEFNDTDGDGIREADGFGPLEFDYITSTNAVRQSNQELIQADLAAVGIKTNMLNVDASLFFDGTCASGDCIWKFFYPMEMFTNGSSSPYAIPTSAVGPRRTSRRRRTPGVEQHASSQLGRLRRPVEEGKTTALDDPRYTEIVIAMNDNGRRSPWFR